MRRSAAVAAVLLLAACQSDELIVPEKPPEIVRVAVKEPVSLCPDGGAKCDLLRDCYDEKAKEQTYGEAKRLANLRTESIAECNARWAKVRALQPEKGE